ncbi:MAG TPA: translocation/assembly module TamB domain-containing protein [Gallionella sp.]|nr:translocation/assembly module TamB domain-containing protein [Gallionella sp.]
MDRIPQTKPRRGKWLAIVLTPCLVVAGGSAWLAGSSSGLKWLVGVAERQSGGTLSANGISGSLFDSFGMQKLVLSGAGWRITVQGAQLQWQPSAMLRGELKVLRLDAKQVEVLSLPSVTPPVLPDSLSLPLAVSVLQMKVGILSVISREGAAPDLAAKDVEARFVSDASRHQLQMLHARLPYGDLAVSGEIASGKPYALKALASLDTAMQLSGRAQHAHFVAEAGGDLQHISVKLDGDGAGVSVNGTAQLAPFSAVPVNRLQIAFSGFHADRLFDGVPPAVVSGSVDLHGKPGGELEGVLKMHNAQAAALDRNGLPLLGVTAQVRLSSSLLQLQQLDVRLLNDSHITGAVSWQRQRGKLGAQLKVRDLDPAALDTRLPGLHLQGGITLEGAEGSQHAVVALGDGAVEFYGELERQGSRVELSSVRLARGKTVLTGQGQLALDRRRTFRFVSQLRHLNLSEFAATPQTDLNAGLEASGTLLPEAQGTLLLDLSGSQFAQYGISGSGHIEFSGVRRATGTVALHLGDNHLDLVVAHGTPADRMQLTLDAPDLAQLGSGLAGRLAGRAELSGGLAQPRLKFSAQGRDLMLPGGQRIAALDATGDLASAAMQLDLGIKDYRSKGTLFIPEASVTLQGSREHHTVHASARIAQGEDALGELTLKASGGLSDPAQGWQTLQWRGALDELAAQGVLPFHLLAAAPLAFARDSIQLGTADVAIAGGQIQFSGTQWTPQRWHSAGNFSGLNVRAVNLQQETPVPDAFDSMRIGGSWQATANEHWQGSLQVQRESGDWVVDANTGTRLGLRDLRLSLSAEQDRLHAQLDASGEHLGEVKVQASMPLTHTGSGWTVLPDAPLAGHLSLHSDDLSWLAPLLDSNLQSGGRLDFDAGLLGTFLSPRLQGEAHGEALSLGLLDQGIRLEQGELKARFEADAVHVDRLAFSAPYLASPRDKLFGNYAFPAGAGQLSASGSLDLQGGSGDLQITAERLPLAQRTDRWIIASGTGHAHYANKVLMLNGGIRADAGLINQPVSDRPRYSDDVQIIGKEPAGRIGPPTGVNATLDLGNHFYIRASGFEGRLDGQLNVRGEPGEPLRVIGIIAAQDSVFNAYGQRLQVERGMVNFQGPLDDPGLNILALRKGLDVEAGVEVTGTVRRPTVRLVSTPNVPDGEKLSWIVLGRVPESSGVDSALLLAAAGSILGGQSTGQLGQSLGVDEISLSQQAGADSQQIQKVTVGKQLSARARISYEQGLTEPGGVTKFSYTLTPRITIVTRTGIEDAVDLFYTFRFY